MTRQQPDFSAARAVLQRHVDGGLLAGASATVLLNDEPIERFCTGLAHIERGEPLRPDHVHRAFSNTKLMTSVLVLMLADEGRFALDDPVKAWLPALGTLRVLRAGATTLDDTEPLQHDITIRHLLSHTAGFSHGVFDPGSLLFNAYKAAAVRGSDHTLAVLVERLATLPLNRQPGSGWEYSLATDVLARLVEIVTGQAFGDALQARVWGPAGMVDTGFVLRADQVPRLAALYVGDLQQPSRPGLTRLERTPWPDAYVKQVAMQSGAGGSFTTQADMLALLRQLTPGRAGLLKPATLAEMMRDQLPSEQCVDFAYTGPITSLGFGLCGAVTRGPSELQPNTPTGELQWGGLAGTHWWISPATGVAGVLMAQRHFGFWHPFWFEYKQAVYAALA
ncbi:MAG: serine hydrolase domain-containing protein [Burkholderiaceae bacterium]